MRRTLVWTLALGLVACSPSLDWREVRPPGSTVMLLFPCKVHTETRTVGLAAASVPLTLSACDAGEGTYAFAHADVGDPAAVGAALDALVQSTARNVGAALSGAGEPVKVPGMTPHSSARRVHLVGHRPDGRAVNVVVWVFSHGTQVHQATLLGSRIDESAAETFFGSLQVVR